MRRSIRRPAQVVLVLAVLMGAIPSRAATRVATPKDTWVIQATPNPGTPDVLNSVTAPSSTNAWAAGYDTISGVTKTLILHYDGSSWVQQTTQNPSTSYNALWGIKANSTTNIWAVGTFAHSSGFDRVLIEHYDGTKWTRQFGVSFTNRNATLYGVSAPSSSNVWAVGNDCTPSFSVCSALIEHYDGTSWKLQTSAAAPCTTQAAVSLTSVSATSSTSAWAAGLCTNTDGTILTFIEHYDGTTWKAQSSPNSGCFNQLSGISANSSTDVWAVGSSSDVCNLPFDRTLIEHYDGSTWTIVSSPNPGSGGNDLQGVKATSSTDAWAVGFYDNVGPSKTMVLHWDGTSWSQETSQNLGSDSDVLNGVAAPSATNVFAAGGDASDTLMEHCC